MAITCRDIMELETCRKLKLVAGKNGLDHIISWPFIKNMDTISEWIHGGELVFVIGAKEDISENGLLLLMQEALQSRISGVVMLYGQQYLKKIPETVIEFADQHALPLFKLPFAMKLIDITREISSLISMDEHYRRDQFDYEGTNLLRLLLEGEREQELLAYCRFMLQPLLIADKINRTEYVKTLGYYLECNNDLIKSAERLYIHRNTMVNRMRKISSLLEKNVNTAEVRNEYYNIFTIMKYYGKIQEGSVLSL